MLKSDDLITQHLVRYDRLLDQTAVQLSDPPLGRAFTLRNVLEQVWEPKYLEPHLARLRQMQTCQQMLQCPVLGVLGELNAGKSSVVASLLSQENRKRVPRGILSRKGTQRFVYWVPQSWLDDLAKKQALYALLRTAHGERCSIQELPEDPAEAEEEYGRGATDVGAFWTPLVAGDSGLDQFALLDCPDMQSIARGEWEESRKSRWEFVVQASRLCSSILFLLTPKNARDKTLRAFLEEVRQHTRPVPLYLLLNCVEPADNMLAKLFDDQEVREIISQVKGFYVAYNYGTPGWQKSIPQALRHEERTRIPGYLRRTWERLRRWWSGGIGSNNPDERLPFFFSVDVQEARQKPIAQLERTESLFALPKQLDMGALQQEKLHQWRGDLLRDICRTKELLDRWAKQKRERADALHKHLWMFCQRLFTTHEDGHRVLRTYVRPELLVAFDEALAEKAPLGIRSLLHFRNKMLATIRAPLKMWKRAKRGYFKSKEIEKAIHKAKPVGKKRPVELPPDELARTMIGLRWVPESLAEPKVAQAWEHILRELERAAENFPNDKKTLRDLAEQQWKSMEQSKRIWLARTLGVVSPLLLVLAAVDGGATLLVWLKLSVIGAPVVAAKLPGAVLVMVSLVPGTLGVLLTPLAQDAGRFLAALFYLACDHFGLPRRMGRVGASSRPPKQITVGETTAVLAAPEELQLGHPPTENLLLLDPLCGIYRTSDSLMEFYEKNRQLLERYRDE